MRAQLRQFRQHRAQAVRRQLHVEGAHRLVHPRPGLLERRHQHQRGDLAEVVRGAHRTRVPGVRQRHGDVRHLPAVQPVVQRRVHGLLDGRVEGPRQRAELHAQPEDHAGAGLRRLHPQPHRRPEVVARTGVELLQPGPDPDGLLDVDGPRLLEVRLDAVHLVERGPDDLLLHLSVEAQHGAVGVLVLPQFDVRVLLAQGLQRGVQPRRLPRALGPDDRLQAGRREEVPRRPLVVVPEPVAHPRLLEPPDLRDVPGRRPRLHGRGAVLEDLERGDLRRVLGDETGVVGAMERHLVAGADGAGPQPQIRDLLTARAPVDLEDGAAERRVRVGVHGRQEDLHAVQQLIDALARHGGAEEHRMDPAAPGLQGQLRVVLLLRQPPVVVEIGREERVAPLGQRLRQIHGELLVLHRAGMGARPSGPDVLDRGHRDGVRGQLLADVVEESLITRAGAVDLVDEQQGGDRQLLQRPHQDAGLRLDPFHRRYHQHGAVEHPERALHLGDEVGVARSVDQIDFEVVEDEGGDGRADRDAPLPFQLHGVGLCGALVDAAHRVDDAGPVQEALGEAGLAGVNVGENPQVQLLHECSSLSDMWPFGLLPSRSRSPAA